MSSVEPPQLSPASKRLEDDFYSADAVFKTGPQRLNKEEEDLTKTSSWYHGLENRCLICNTLFFGIQGLIQHIAELHENREDGKKYKLEFGLSLTAAGATTSTNFQCQVCDEVIQGKGDVIER